MDRQHCVLILYTRFGDGHLQVAKALKQAFFKQGITDVHIIDLFALAHPIITSITRIVYLKAFSTMPTVYGWSYKRTKHMDHNSRLSHLFNSFGVKKLKEIIEEKKPTIVINTFPMQVMPEFFRKEGVHIPTFTVMTDYSFHQRWIHPETDKLYVATDELKSRVGEAGIPQEKIVTSGIPIRATFDRGIAPNQAYERFGLDRTRKKVLIMAGGDAVIKSLTDICEELLLNEQLDIIFVCGRNEDLKQQIEAAYPHNKNLHVLGFVEEIHELMSISSCIVTKAGGVTLSEALAMHIPIVIFNPVPGQEKDNADYLASIGAALVVDHADAIGTVISGLLMNEQLQETMKEAAKKIYHRNASEMIVSDILKELEVKKI